jgi:gliding motility-associated-like protein
MFELKYRHKYFPKTNLSRYFLGFFCFLLLSTFGQTSLAQTQSTPVANFEMDQVIGCAPFIVTPNNLLAGNPILYYFENTLNPEDCSVDYRGGNGTSCFNGRLEPLEKIEPLTSAGVYYIGQINGSAVDGNKISYIKVTVIEAKEPDFEVFTCANNSVHLDLDFSQNEYDSYQINFGDGSDPIIYDKGTIAEDQVDYTFETMGNFDITVTGRIGGQTVSCGTKTTRVSSEINVQKPAFTSLTIQNNILRIQYERIEPIFLYELTIKALDGSQTEVIQLNPSASPDQRFFDDPAFDFSNKVYSLSMKVTDFCNNFEDTSELVYTVSATWQAAYVVDQIDLDVSYSTGPEGLSGVVFQENNSPQENFPTANGTVQRLLTDCTQAGEYSFIATFGSTISSSIVLRPDFNGMLTPESTRINTGELINVSFKLEFDPAPTEATRYIIFRKDLNGDLQQVGTSNTNTFTDTTLDREQVELCYVIRYEDNCGNISDPSNEECFIISLRNSSFPNAFSPNGDGINDLFIVGQGSFLQFSMTIFNRWGALIFQTTDPAVGWNGTFNGAPVSSGGYIYQIRFTDINNSNIQQSGNLLLIR